MIDRERERELSSNQDAMVSGFGVAWDAGQAALQAVEGVWDWRWQWEMWPVDPVLL